jgi:hypothetical protein
LSEPARQLDADPGLTRVGPVESTYRSKLFASLFQLRDVNHRLTVLEIGTALPETVEFFSQFKCRLHFVDLFHEPFVAGQADLSETELRHAFEEQIRFPTETRIDLCLFWDFLSYLDDPALRAFNSALLPWLHGASRGYGFGVHHLAIRLANVQYGVQDRETLSMRKRFTTQMRCHPHSHIEMREMLSGFDFERGLLLPDGKLEMLLKSRV